MNDIGGYVTDVPYVLGFKPMLAPAWLDHVALLWGYEPPTRAGGFAWCDLGCGQGVTAAILAATHPGGAFHGIDAMLQHIEHASQLAAEAGAANASFHTADFDAASGLDLPRFDYIVAHGVYSWVDEPVRAALRRFVDRHLAPGGLVYLSYNAMPGWTIDLPFQRLVRELGTGFAGDSAAQFAGAAGLARKMADAQAPALAASYVLDDMGRHPEEYRPGYLVHEFMHAGWQALYVTDVRREMAQIGLRPVGSTTLVENFDGWVLGEQGRALLAGIADPDRRELARDFLIDQRLRCDVFARDARRLDPAARHRRFFETGVALARPAATISYATPTPAGRLEYDNRAAHAVVASLASGARSLAEITAAAPEEDLLANALVLCAAGDVRPVEIARAPVARLNAALRGRFGTDQEIAALALPCGTALDIGADLIELLQDGRDSGGWRDFLVSHGL